MVKYINFYAPVAGVKQGSYEPAMILVTPKKQQVINLGIDYAISKRTAVTTEVARSNYDANTFSKVNNGDDAGYAAKFRLTNTLPISTKKPKDLNLLTTLDYEYVQDKFKPLKDSGRLNFQEIGDCRWS